MGRGQSQQESSNAREHATLQRKSASTHVPEHGEEQRSRVFSAHKWTVVHAAMGDLVQAKIPAPPAYVASQQSS